MIYGSSELSSKSKYKSFLFIPEYSNLEAVATGSGGYQSLNILLSLKLNEPYLKHSKVVFLISPSWFTGSYAQGLTADYLIKTNSHFGFSRIYKNFEEDIESSNYISKQLFEIAKGEITNTPFGLELILNYEQHDVLTRVKKLPQDVVISIKLKLTSLYNSNFKNEIWELDNSDYDQFVEAITFQRTKNQKDFDKNKAINEAIRSTDSLCSNNNWGILNGYYSNYINGKHSTLDIVELDDNQEYRDFLALINYVERKEIDATFIMQPLNPYYYQNLAELKPIIDQIGNDIQETGFPYLDMTVVDSNNYQIGTLQDVMHLGDLGWIEINDFIISNYIE